MTAFWMMCWQRSERGGLHWFKPWQPKSEREAHAGRTGE